jgi:hypothetical protein
MIFQRIMSYVFTLWMWQSVCTHDKTQATNEIKADKSAFIKILSLCISL